MAENRMWLEAEGQVDYINPPRNVSKTTNEFIKADIGIIWTDDSTGYDKNLEIQFNKDKANMVGVLKIGQQVKIRFIVDGAKPSEGKSAGTPTNPKNLGSFTNLTGIKIQVLDANNNWVVPDFKAEPKKEEPPKKEEEKAPW